MWSRRIWDPATCTAWLPAAEAALGPVDVLINNAGMQVIGPTAEVDVERAELSLRLNLLSPLRLTHAVLPGMLARGRGCIVDVASMAALAPTPAMTWYNASKAGLAGASEALRGELRGTGVHVVTVYPGIIETDMGKAGLAAYQKSRLLALQPRGTTEGLAARVVRAVDRRRPRVIYPAVYGMTRWLPPLTRWFMDRLTPPLAHP
ncbi:MAG: SDR family NAD(P)-dependent oxidoreductase [bacterium]